MVSAEHFRQEDSFAQSPGQKDWASLPCFKNKPEGGTPAGRPSHPPVPVGLGLGLVYGDPGREQDWALLALLPLFVSETMPLTSMSLIFLINKIKADNPIPKMPSSCGMP